MHENSFRPYTIRLGTESYPPASEYVPFRDIPVINYMRGYSGAWCATDSEDNYLKNNGHEVFGPESIHYRFNSYGYRSPEPFERGDITICSFGCSHTVGIGLPLELSYAEQLAELLRRRTGQRVVNINLGVSASSVDCVSRLVHLAVPLLRPDIVVIFFPQIPRRDYFAADDSWIRYLPGDSVDPARHGATREIWRPLKSLESRLDSQIGFFRSYKGIEAALRGQQWVFGCAGLGAIPPELAVHLDRSRMLTEFTVLDLARDSRHAGPLTHQGIATGFYRVMEGMGWFDRSSQESRA